MIVVTGAAGFIGSNLVKALNDRGERDLVAVDNLARADKVANLADLDIADSDAVRAAHNIPLSMMARTLGWSITATLCPGVDTTIRPEPH